MNEMTKEMNTFLLSLFLFSSLIIKMNNYALYTFYSSLKDFSKATQHFLKWSKKAQQDIPEAQGNSVLRLPLSPSLLWEQPLTLNTPSLFQYSQLKLTYQPYSLLRIPKQASKISKLKNTKRHSVSHHTSIACHFHLEGGKEGISRKANTMKSVCIPSIFTKEFIRAN